MSGVPFPPRASAAEMRQQSKALNEAEGRLIRAANDVRDEAKAEGYELGYKAGYAKGAERTSAPNGTVARDDMLAMLDRVQLFRQSLATYDTRYDKLGEIVGDFARLLEPEQRKEGAP